MRYRRVWILVFIFTLTTINYADRVALSVAAKPIAAEFGLSPSQMGWLLSSFLWMYVFCLIPVGLAVDRFGGKVVNAAGIALWSAATVLTGFSPGYYAMVATRVAMGMGESTSWPACNRIIREWFPATERGLANSMLSAGAAAGPAIGAAAIGAIVGTMGWRTGFIAAGSIGFLWLAVWWALFDRPEKVRWLHPEERARILAERDGGAAAAPEAIHPPSSLRYLLCQRSVWGLFFTQGLEVYGGYMLLTWLPSYLQAAKGLSVANAGLMMAIPFGIGSVMAVVLGTISDRILSGDARQSGRRRNMLAIMMICDSIFLAVPFVDSLAVILAILTVARAMGAAGSTLNFALVTDLVRSRADIGKVTSITVVGGNSFGLSAPIITGYVVQASGGYNGAFIIAGTLALIGAAVTLTMTRKPILPEALARREAYA